MFPLSRHPVSGRGNKDEELKTRRQTGGSRKREETVTVLKTHCSGKCEVSGHAAMVTGSRSQAVGIALQIEGR